MKLFDRIKDRLSRKQEITETIAKAEVSEGVPTNREYRRNEANWQRRRGAGYTRPMRKGRTKRHA